MSLSRYQETNCLCRIWEEEKLQEIFWVSRLDMQVSQSPYGYPTEFSYPGVIFIEPCLPLEVTIHVVSGRPLFLYPGHRDHRIYLTFAEEKEHRFNKGTLCDVTWDVYHLGVEQTTLQYIFSKRPEYTLGVGGTTSLQHNNLPDIPLYPFYRSILIPFGSDFNLIKKFESDLLFGSQTQEEKETIRGIYVDWLGDNGDFEYAELVREHGLSFEKLVQLQREYVAS